MAKKVTVNGLNDAQLHNFFKGWQTDIDEHLEDPQNYIDSWNGRLYNENGTLSFCSLKGSKKIYENENIVEYNGGYAFKDELILFGKCNEELSEVNMVDQIIETIVVDSFSVSAPEDSNTISGIDFTNHFNLSQIIIQVPEISIDETDFTQNFSEVQPINVINDTFNGLFKSFPYFPSTACSLSQNEIPINNQVYKDFILSISFNSNKELIANFRFIGYLNIPHGAIITTAGVEENSYYKRVYFSDYYNPTRVVNLKDTSVSKRSMEEFNIKTKGVLLNPRIKSINENGQLKAMTVFYVYKLITENGQVTDFSALSKPVKIVKNSTDLSYGGGNVSEITNKSVSVECYVPDYKNFKDIQLIAIEYEAKDIPTAIRLVATKTVSAIVQFEHFGSEPLFQENITLSDLFANSISWRYNSDFATKNNKMIAVGLRNDPSYLNSKNIALDFSLNGFSENGETHTSLLNPDPLKYNFINAAMTENFFYVKRKLFRKIEVFGNFKMKLENKLTGDYFEFEKETVDYNYVDLTSDILEFLLDIKTNVSFATKFPNLDIIKTNNRILFKPINENIQTDFYYYNLSFTTTQVIIDMDNDIENKNYAWPSTTFDKENKLVYGAVSNGWFRGNGVRVTMHTVKENVLSKNTNWMTTNVHPLQTKAPSLTKYVMKGEIYRLGIQCYKDGNRLFTVILGDIKIPDIGQKKRELNESGQIISTSEKYVNWSVSGNEMYSEGIQLQFDVRINCELSKEIDAYQIVYVERTENNRTILAQGISAPLERVIDFTGSGDESMFLEETMIKKWMLPGTGGPVYDNLGFKFYDQNPDVDTNNNYSFYPIPIGLDNGYINPRRIITNRKAFYFDSPDLIHNKISSNFIESCVLEYIESIATDHDRHNIMGPYNKETSSPIGQECYSATGSRSSEGPVVFGNPKFSQKIPFSLLSGDEKGRPFFVNVSVFANRLRSRTYSGFSNTLDDIYKYEIDKSQEAGTGEILSSYKMNDKFDYANHALCLASPGWYYQRQARVNGADKYSLFRVHNIAGGRDTIFIKTKENYFSDTNIAQTPYIVNSRVNFGTDENEEQSSLKANDSYIVSNLKRNNEDSVYGGRSEFAYSSNEYIPLSDVFPVISNRIVSQTFYVEGDTYCSLYIRNKTSYLNSAVPEEIGFHWSRRSSEGNRKYQYNKYNAWCYAVVLESTIEPKLTNAEEFYKFSSAIDFSYEEKMNTAYLQENDLRKSIPKPYDFKDDPILNNVIAVSKTKLNGDSIDAWTQFLTNEFYELDKDKGSALNIVKENDEIFVVQERQTSKIQIDERSFITPDNDGAAIQISQGSGTSVTGHTIVSNYGTSFRRAIVKSPFGFIFYDERKHEIVKIIEPLLLKNNLLLHIKSLFENDNVINVSGYYDEKYKETNIRFRTKSGNNFVISYNELLQCFNGKYKYDNDIYFEFQEKVITPYADSQKLAHLNDGEELEFFEEKQTLKIKVLSAPNPTDTKINKGIVFYTNIKYPIIKAIFETSLGHFKKILGTHHWYKIREGIHTMPAKNQNDTDDIRGEWCTIELEIESKQGKKINLFSIINYYRKSYK